ncbi:hypothetical protein M7I_7010 [Glarea lozoyensis 74030]|uniref:Uncharacterized protein n=1 Tax=Glarea lozoyensis (strain ATCC 74030 / MF5533) TaxID=1104152 RepID=H0EW34_GLAL7|nr:hypothetical protein M7I_7010 [Glarea lozoyensis 74030]
MKACVADSTIAASNLENLHYLTEQKYEGSEEYVGPLLDVNSRLMDALKAFVNEDGSLDAESDSDDELAAQQHAFRMIEERHKTRQNTDAFSQNAFANMGSSSSKSPEKAPPMPPRRAPMAAPPQNEDDEADNDPFGDGNALDTPGAEKDEPRW